MTDQPAIEIPFFTPVPLTRNRHDGWTPARQRIFIAALAATGVIAKAAKAAGMGVTSAYNLRRRKGAESFAAAWALAEQEASDRALDGLLARLRDGALIPRYYRGRYLGTIHRVEHGTAMAALKLVYPLPRGRPAK